MTEYYEAETHEELAEAIQRRINDGSIWRLEGSAGRTAMSLINDGLCMLGQTDFLDYWGNHIPSRDQVVDGTKGSFNYVADRNGTEWADRIANIPTVQLRGETA